MNRFNTDCFAYSTKENSHGHKYFFCKALHTEDCVGCKFYKVEEKK